MHVMIIPGNGNSSVQDHWIPSVSREIQALGVTVIAEDMPDPKLARERFWMPFIEEKIAQYQDAVIIGHSSGAIAAMRYAERHKMAGIVLVGGYHTDLDDENERLSGYFDRAWDWDAIKRNTQWIAIFSSVDDPYIPIEEARHLHAMLGAEYHEFTNLGHMGDDVGMQEFPEILALISRKLAK